MGNVLEIPPAGPVSFEIRYYRVWPIIFGTGVGPMSAFETTLAQVKSIGTVVAVIFYFATGPPVEIWYSTAPGPPQSDIQPSPCIGPPGLSAADQATQDAWCTVQGMSGACDGPGFAQFLADAYRSNWAAALNDATSMLSCSNTAFTTAMYVVVVWLATRAGVKPPPPPTPPTAPPPPAPLPPPTPTPTCPVGYTWDAASGSCLPNPTTPSCPPGQFYDAATESCVVGIPTPTCPVGFYLDPQTKQCLPVPVPPPNPTCPPGFHWDSTSETCVPDRPPPPPVPNPNLDEIEQLENCLCDNFTQLNLYIKQYLTLITQAQGAPGPGSTEQCCKSIVAAIGDVAAGVGQLIAALSALPAAGLGSIDLTPIVTQLEQLVTLLASLGNLGPLLNQVLEKYLTDDCCAQLRRIADDFDSMLAAPPPLPDPREIIRSMARYLAQNSGLDSGVAQIVES